MLIEIFNLDSTLSAIILTALATILAIALILVIVLFILIQRGILHIKITKATRSIFGKPKTNVKVEPEKDYKKGDEDLAPLKITVFDIKEERKKMLNNQKNKVRSNSKPEKKKVD